MNLALALRHGLRRAGRSAGAARICVQDGSERAHERTPAPFLISSGVQAASYAPDPVPSPPTSSVRLQARLAASGPRSLRVVPFPTRADTGDALQEINGCKMLLLEIVRRTAFDWILYRTSRRLPQKTLAEQAYRWLFVELPGSADWAERAQEGKALTSFVSICAALDLDPEEVRGHIRQLTPKSVMSVGRPAEYRKHETSVSDEMYSVGGRSLPASDPSLDDDLFY